jgi:hypothetical protein
MSFSGDIYAHDRWSEFAFYSGENGSNGAVQQSIGPDEHAKARRFTLTEIRMHWSVPFISQEYLKIYISADRGSNFNYIILSHTMLDIQDYRAIWPSGEEVSLNSDDHLVFEMSCGSANNTYGLEVRGWAIEA